MSGPLERIKRDLQEIVVQIQNIRRQCNPPDRVEQLESAIRSIRANSTDSWIIQRCDGVVPYDPNL